MSKYESAVPSLKAEYESGSRNMYCQRDSLLKKTTCPGLISLRAQVLTLLIQKNLSARASGTLIFKSYWLKNISIINEISIFVRFLIFRLDRGRSGIPLLPIGAAYQQLLGRASKHLVASDLSCGEVLWL